MSGVINIPEEYWLNVNNFDINDFNYRDLRDIFDGPNILIDDFKLIPEFNDKVIEINKITKEKKEKLEQDKMKHFKELKESTYIKREEIPKYGELNPIPPPESLKTTNILKLPSIFNIFKKD
jgi:hypothetical protein